MYTEISPNSKLSQFVQSFWRIRTGVSDSPERTEVLPDGCFDIVIYIHNSKENDVLLTGIWDRPISVTTPPDANIVGVRLYPSAIDPLLKMSLTELKNISIPLPIDKVNIPSNLLLNTLYTSTDPEELIGFLELILTLLIEGNQQHPNDFLHKLLNSDISSSIKDIAENLGISERHLTRKLNELFGIRTKTYLSILRFINAQRILSEKRDFPLSQIAVEAGYYDQAHLTREFKKYSGKTPKQYISEDV